MRLGSKRYLPVIFVMAAALAGCAGLGRIQTTSVRSGNHHIVSIEAGRFYFRPNEIHVDKPGSLTIEIENTSASQENFTLKGPRWHTLESIDLPPHQTTIINVKFHMSGIYQFYCNRTLHSFLGMNGQISVGK